MPRLCSPSRFRLCSLFDPPSRRLANMRAQFQHFEHVPIRIATVSGLLSSKGERRAMKRDAGGLQSFILCLNVGDLDTKMSDAMITDGPDWIAWPGTGM